MRDNKNVKKIDLGRLDDVERKISLKNIKKITWVGMFIVLIGVLTWGIHWMTAQEVLGARFIINKMTCPGCVVTITDTTSKIQGVIESSVSLAAQGAIITFDRKKTNPEAIESAIANAGYTVKQDGLFRPSGQGINETLLASINGRPLFQRDTMYTWPETQDNPYQDAASGFFDLVSKEILLQEADKKEVFVQQDEIKDQIERLKKANALSPAGWADWAEEKYGSIEKYTQIVAQRILIRKLTSENVVQNHPERRRKTIEWLARLFRESNVKIVDQGIKRELLASTGKDNWKELWPRMINRDTALRQLLALQD